MRRTAAVGTVSTVLAAIAAGCGGEDVRGRGDPVAGKVVFTDAAEPGCGRCHTLADAEAEGTIGPNLDFLRPGYQQVLDAVRLLLFAIVNVAVDPCR